MLLLTKMIQVLPLDAKTQTRNVALKNWNKITKIIYRLIQLLKQKSKWWYI